MISPYQDFHPIAVIGVLLVRGRVERAAGVGDVGAERAAQVRRRRGGRGGAPQVDRRRQSRSRVEKVSAAKKKRVSGKNRTLF